MESEKDIREKKRVFQIDYDKKVAEVAVFLTVAVFVYMMFFIRLNTVIVVATVLAAAFSVMIFLSCVIRRKVSIWMISSYIMLMGGSVLFFIIMGAEPFFRRLGYNLLISSLSVIALLLLIYSPKIMRKFNIRCSLLSMSASLILILSTVLYIITMSIRIRPNVIRMQRGHDEYLASIESLSYSNDAPNVLVILMDDMAYADLASYSYLGSENATISTPNIDSIGEDGVFMDNFYSCSPVCSPSRFGLLTGRYPCRGYLDEVVFPTCVSLKPFGSTRYFNPFLFKNNVDGILSDEITIAETLQAYGYNTGLFGKWNLGDYGEYLPTNQGFDYFFGSHYVNDMTPYNIVREQKGEFTQVYSHYDMLDQSHTTKMLTEEVKGFIENSVADNEKFFAYYCTPWPHYPIFSGEKDNKSDDNYIDCIEEFDTYLGEILTMLKAKGVYDDTLIVFTSDNGPGREGAAGALRGRKGTTFEGGQKVPMLVCYKNGGIGMGESFAGIDGRRHIESSAMNIDLFPTILEFAGIDKLPRDRIIDGVSLYGLLKGNIQRNARVHDILYYIRSGNVQGIQMPADTGGTTYDFKYYDAVRSENTAFFDQVYRNYLFNLDLDPIEAYNVSMIYPEIAEKLKSELISFRQELADNRRGRK